MAVVNSNKNDFEIDTDKIFKQAQKPVSLSKNDIKETLEKMPKLEKENFKIQWTIEEKEALGRTKIQAKGYINWKETNITVLQNPQSDIWEYVDWVPEIFKWEQLFTLEAALRETKNAGKKMVWSLYEMDRLIDREYWSDYISFKRENMKFVGWRKSDNQVFENINKEFTLWFADGSFSYWYKANGINHWKSSPTSALSVRCYQ